MNPSYSNGGLGNSGVRPGIITSMPDQNPQPSQPMQLGSNSKGPNKKLIIGALVAVVVLIVVLVVVIMLQGNGNKNNTNNNTQNSTSNNDTQQTEEEQKADDSVFSGDNADFYQYMSYILNGAKNNSANLVSYSANKKYAVVTAIENNNTKFFQNIDTLWNTFYNRVSKNTELSDLVTAQNLLMDFFTKYVGMKDWTEDEMWELYNKDGLESAIKTVRADYAKLEATNYEKGVSWAKLKGDWSEAAIRLYDAYKSKGCIKENISDFDQTCIDENTKDMKDVMKKFIEVDSQLEGADITVDGLLETLIKNCFEIKNILGSGGEKES